MHHRLEMITALLFFAMLTACAPRALRAPVEDVSRGTGIPGKAVSDLPPHARASLRLTEQARRQMEDNRPDEAIMTLEKSVNLNPANGLNYYYLAEAWCMKGDMNKALEFNRLAGMALADSRSWTLRIETQQSEIAETGCEEGEVGVVE